MAYGTFAGAFERGAELPMPTPYLTNEMTVALDCNKGRLFLGAEYRASYFTNRAPGLLFENWFRDTPFGTPGSANRGQSAVGQAAMPPPSNRGNSFSLRAMLLLPMNSRASALINFTRWTQDEAFLPYTVNTAIPNPASIPGGTSLTSVDSLPQRSYNGEMNILTKDYAFVSRPVKFFQYQHGPMNRRFTSNHENGPDRSRLNSIDYGHFQERSVTTAMIYRTIVRRSTSPVASAIAIPNGPPPPAATPPAPSPRPWQGTPRTASPAPSGVSRPM